MYVYVMGFGKEGVEGKEMTRPFIGVGDRTMESS